MATDRASPALRVAAKTVSAQLKGAKGRNGRLRRRRNHRKLSLGTLARFLGDGGELGVLLPRLADNDTGAADPLRDGDNVSSGRLVGALVGFGGDVRARNSLGMLIDDFVAGPVERSNKAIVDILLGCVRRHPLDGAMRRVSCSEEKAPSAGELALGASGMRFAVLPVEDTGQAVDRERTVKRDDS